MSVGKRLTVLSWNYLELTSEINLTFPPPSLGKLVSLILLTIRELSLLNIFLSVSLNP